MVHFLGSSIGRFEVQVQGHLSSNHCFLDRLAMQNIIPSGSPHRCAITIKRNRSSQKGDSQYQTMMQERSKLELTEVTANVLVCAGQCWYSSSTGTSNRFSEAVIVIEFTSTINSGLLSHTSATQLIAEYCTTQLNVHGYSRHASPKSLLYSFTKSQVVGQF